MPVTKSGTDLSLVFAEGIGLHSVPAHHRAAYVKPQFASPEAARHVMQERLYLLLVKIHQHTLHDEDKFPVGMFAAQVVHPADFQQGRREIDIARLFGYQLPAQGDDLRQVKVIKDRFPVPDTLETGIQPTSHIHDNRTGMHFDKPSHGTVEIPSKYHPRTTHPTSLSFAPSNWE